MHQIRCRLWFRSTLCWVAQSTPQTLCLQFRGLTSKKRERIESEEKWEKGKRKGKDGNVGNWRRKGRREKKEKIGQGKEKRREGKGRENSSEFNTVFAAKNSYSTGRQVLVRWRVGVQSSECFDLCSPSHSSHGRWLTGWWLASAQQTDHTLSE